MMSAGVAPFIETSVNPVADKISLVIFMSSPLFLGGDFEFLLGARKERAQNEIRVHTIMS